MLSHRPVPVPLLKPLVTALVVVFVNTSLMLGQAQPTDVREQGLFARFHLPEEDGPHPGLLVVGGSEGGIEGADRIAIALAEEGYAVLSLAYFAAEGLPEQLIEIPIETFLRGLDVLAESEHVDQGHIGFIGSSKGAEAALFVASIDNRIDAVVAAVPSHVVWQGVDRKAWSKKSSWSYRGEPLPFVPYDLSGGAFPLARLYRNSLEKASDIDTARIRVETIAGAVLLLSGEQDGIWPSTLMANQVIERLRTSDFRNQYQHLSYPGAGHAVLRPLQPPIDPARLKQALPMMGGTAEGTIAAIEDSWPKVLAFLDRHLKPDND